MHAYFVWVLYEYVLDLAKDCMSKSRRQSQSSWRVCMNAGAPTAAAAATAAAVLHTVLPRLQRSQVLPHRMRTV